MKKAIALLLSAILAVPAVAPAFAQEDKAEKKKPSRAEAREKRREAREQRREKREARREKRQHSAPAAEEKK